MRGRDTRITGQRTRFLELLAMSCNVTASAAEVGWTRRAAYRARETDEEFAEEWDVAVQAAIDTLEAEARRRALEGVEEYVVSGGRVVIDPETQLPLKQRRHSDTLMSLLLKAHRPDKFKDRSAVENTGRIVINLSGDDANL